MDADKGYAVIKLANISTLGIQQKKYGFVDYRFASKFFVYKSEKELT